MINLLALLTTCAPLVHPETMYPLIQVESGYNPYAIAVVNGRALPRQPRTRLEAEAAIDALEANGLNYSVGLAQINKANFTRYSVSARDLLNPCTNLQVSQQILTDCYKRSAASVAQALSCYYSGNFNYGFVREKNIGTSYVERIASAYKPKDEMVVPSIASELDSIPKQIKRRTAYRPVRRVKSKPKLIKSMYAKQNFQSNQSIKE